MAVKRGSAPSVPCRVLETRHVPPAFTRRRSDNMATSTTTTHRSVSPSTQNASDNNNGSEHAFTLTVYHAGDQAAGGAFYFSATTSANDGARRDNVHLQLLFHPSSFMYGRSADTLSLTVEELARTGGLETNDGLDIIASTMPASVIFSCHHVDERDIHLRVAAAMSGLKHRGAAAIGDSIDLANQLVQKRRIAFPEDVAEVRRLIFTDDVVSVATLSPQSFVEANGGVTTHLMLFTANAEIPLAQTFKQMRGDVVHFVEDHDALRSQLTGVLNELVHPVRDYAVLVESASSVQRVNIPSHVGRNGRYIRFKGSVKGQILTVLTPQRVVYKGLLSHFPLVCCDDKVLDFFASLADAYDHTSAIYNSIIDDSEALPFAGVIDVDPWGMVEALGREVDLLEDEISELVLVNSDSAERSMRSMLRAVTTLKRIKRSVHSSEMGHAIGSCDHNPYRNSPVFDCGGCDEDADLFKFEEDSFDSAPGCQSLPRPFSHAGGIDSAVNHIRVAMRHM